MAVHAASCQDVGVSFVPLTIDSLRLRTVQSKLFPHWAGTGLVTGCPAFCSGTSPLPGVCNLPLVRKCHPLGSLHVFQVTPLSLTVSFDSLCCPIVVVYIHWASFGSIFCHDFAFLLVLFLPSSLFLRFDYCTFIVYYCTCL